MQLRRLFTLLVCALPASLSNSSAGFFRSKLWRTVSPLLGFYAVMLAPIYGIGLGPGLGSITDFQSLRNRNPEGVISNEYILCPPSFCPNARTVSPSVYSVSAEDLLQTIDEVIVQSPRVTVIDTSKEPPLIREYIQRTLIFRFPDVITVQTIPLEPHRSTLAIHSYSIYGAGDLGVNANRVKTWVTELDQRIPPVQGEKAQ